MKPAAPLIATSDLLPLTPNQSETYPGTIKTVRYASVNTLTMLPIEGDPELRLAKCVLALMVLGFAPCLSYRYASCASVPGLRMLFPARHAWQCCCAGITALSIVAQDVISLMSRGRRVNRGPQMRSVH